MAESIKFLKTREVKSPSRSNQYDAGIDFYVPEFTPEFIKAVEEKNPGLKYIPLEDGFQLKPQERILIPSGIHCQMANHGRALIAANKSGVATKTGLIFGAQVVDYEYQGEIHISLINTGNSSVRIYAGMKAIQFLETPIYNSEILISESLSVDKFYETSTSRGADGFGSTDKK
jgi:deoxyuridine 5'-triphosphate nucleotidohydrolase